MEQSKHQVADIAKTLQQDRLISLTIGNSSTPIQIQQTVLEATSEWFKNAVKYEAFVESKRGKIDFPDDDSEAWELLACWIATRDLLIEIKNAEDILLCAKCWNLGDKYDIKQFQDEAMMKLIRYYEGRSFTIEDEKLERLLKVCRSGSPLATLLAEELVCEIDQNESSSRPWDGIKHLDIGQLWQDFCNAQAQFVRNPEWELFGRLCSKSERKSEGPSWKDYMVGNKIDRTFKKQGDD